MASKVDQYPRGPGPWLETACFTETNALPPREHDLFSELEQKNEASVIAQSWLFDLAEVDNTVPAGAKEDGAVQPALAFLRERRIRSLP